MRRTRSCAVLLALACGLTTLHARAEPPAPAPGTDALASARDAWQKRRFSAAELYYKSALDHGGLSPADTLDAYVHLGAARARLGKKELARAAFRQAALIDAHFKTPPEAGRKAAQVAALARHDEAKLGSIALSAAIPQSVPPGESFSVDATLDPNHARVTAKVGIDATEPSSGKHFATSDVGATSTHFEVPASLVFPGSTLVVRIDALDPHDNRLASREQRVHVDPMPVAALAPLADVPPPPKQPASAAPPVAVTIPFDLGPSPKDKSDKSSSEKHGGFWSTPWPYLIGGVVLAAGGAVAYYELRPTDDVSLGGARVTTR